MTFRSRTLGLAALAVLVASGALAAVTVGNAPGTISAVMKFVWNNDDISDANAVPVKVVSGGGGGGGGGSVTAPGTSGTQAMAVQGVTGGVPQNVTQSPTSAIAVQRTTAIGTTGTLVSAAAPDARRTVTNTSAIACELMGSAAAYGTGYPLPAGGSFTFDASGRTTAALYVACASASGTVAVLSY